MVIFSQVKNYRITVNMIIIYVDKVSYIPVIINFYYSHLR